MEAAHSSWLLECMFHMLKSIDMREKLTKRQATYITAARRILPEYPLSHISFSRSYSTHFGAALPNLGYSLAAPFMAGILGSRFLRHARDRGASSAAPVLTWTVNDGHWMRWMLDRNLVRDGGGGVSSRRVLDAVITDDPRQFRAVCEQWEDELDGKKQVSGTGLMKMVKDGWRDGWEAAKYTFVWAMLLVVRRLSKRFDTLPEVVRGKVQ